MQDLGGLVAMLFHVGRIVIETYVALVIDGVGNSVYDASGEL